MIKKVQMQGGDSGAGFAGAMGEVRKGAGEAPSEESLRRRWAFFISLLSALPTPRHLRALGRIPQVPLDTGCGRVYDMSGF